MAEFFQMEKTELVRGMVLRSSLLLLLLVMSGCSLLFPEPPPPVTTTIPEVEPEPVVETEPELPAEPAPIVEPEPVVPPPPAPPEPISALVAVVLSDRMPAYSDVANALGQYLKNYEVYDLGDHSRTPKEAFAAIAESGVSAVVAVGMPAAVAAKRFSTAPVVFSQVFNISDSGLLSDNVKGVAVLPPIELQIDAWRELNPGLRNVGAIIGSGHDDLIAEADKAMQEKGIKFHYAIAGSDRETLYLFNRLTRDIDGFLLFPDNRILSRSVLDEMMTYASQHRVQIAVFNESLLNHGALFSASSVPADIASTIVAVLDAFLSEGGQSVPPVSKLSDIAIKTNPELVQTFGLDIEHSTGDVAVADTQ